MKKFHRSFPALLLAALLIPMSTALFAQGGGDSSKTPTADGVDQVLSTGVSTSSGSGLRGVQTPMFNGGSALEMKVGTLGATVGGAQDIGFARTLIKSGMVPKFIDFSPEGLYSEHDIPTPSSQCDDRICLSLGYGYAPTADNESNALFVHVGMNSNITAETFHRQPLQLALVIDKSGSMDGSSIEAVRQALKTLVGKLGPDDEILLVEFNEEAKLLLPPTRVTDRARIITAINALAADGGTDIEAGLTLGFSALADLPSRSGAVKRLMLFTDAMPNIGRTDSTSFRMLTERYSAEGIGLTAFGVGVDFGQELMYHISQLRGGNSYYLESPEKIARVFDSEFDYLVTPLVYDLDVRIATPKGLKLTAVYGLPTWKPGSADAELHIPTVFLSSNRGAIVLRYEKDGEGPLAIHAGDEIATGALSYTDVDGSAHKEETVLRHTAAQLQPGMQYYTHDGMRMAVALTNVYFGLRDACRLISEGKRDEALAALGRGRGVAMIENMQLADKGLGEEIALLDKLEENIQKGAQVRQPAPIGSR